MHKEQKIFCRRVKKDFPEFFRRKKVVDVGSLDINGSNRPLFKGCNYIGIDLIEGRNVDMIGNAHELLPLVSGTAKYSHDHKEYLLFPTIDTVISTECLEHDKYWKLTLITMYQTLKEGGLMIVTAGGDGREEHGTKEKHGWCSPATNDYYMNISNQMFGSVLSPEMFQVYHLAQNNKDLQFFGIKKWKQDTPS